MFNGNNKEQRWREKNNYKKRRARTTLRLEHYKSKNVNEEEELEI